MKLAVVSLQAEDVVQAAHFYRDVVGLEMAGHHGHMPDFDLNGTYLAIIQRESVSKSTEGSIQFPGTTIIWIFRSWKEASIC